MDKPVPASSTEAVLERAMFFRHANLRMQREIKELREKEAMLRKTLLEDWYPTLQRQYDDEAKAHSTLEHSETLKEQRDQIALGLATTVVPATRRSGDRKEATVLAAADELRHVMKDHVLSLRELELKHHKAARRIPTGDL